MPEMAAAVSKLMRVQDLIAVAARTMPSRAFRTTVGLPGRLSTRPAAQSLTDDPAGIVLHLDGLLLSSGDAVIGINPASDSISSVTTLLRLIDRIRLALKIPIQSCVPPASQHRWKPCGRVSVDLVFQSIAGTEAANASASTWRCSRTVCP